MYNFSPILSSLTIGDSLPLVNTNYQFLDTWTSSIQLSASNFWQPMVDLYNSQIDGWNQSLTFAQQNSSKWVSMATTVENTSAKWLTPITLFYPYIYPVNTDLNTIKNTILKWLNQNFPITVSYRDIPFYAETQKIIVYNYSYFINKNFDIQDFATKQTTCTTVDGVGIASCYNQFTGTAYCSNGNVNCYNYASNCTAKQYVNCYFDSQPNGPYIVGQGYKTILVERDPIVTVDEDGVETVTEQEPEKVVLYGALNDTGLGYIKANIRTKFTDRRESEQISYFKFEVQNCEWTYIPEYINSTQPQISRSYLPPPPQDSYIILSQAEDILTAQDGSTIIWYRSNIN